jgi:hypothetical protein
MQQMGASRRYLCAMAAMALGGWGSAICEHNDQVHRLFDMFAARAGPEAEAETSCDSKPAITTDLLSRAYPFSTPAPTT